MRGQAVFHLMGWVLSALSVLMLFAAVFAWAMDPLVLFQAFIIPAFAVGFFGGCLILSFGGRTDFSSRWESLLLLGLVWSAVPIAAALPFYTAGYPKGFVAAYFEATSGFTTTGSSAIVDLGQTPPSIIVWRALLQWAGGLTTLLSIAALMGPLAGSFMLDRQLRVIGRSTHGTLHHMIDSLRSITPIYLALTMGCFALLTLCGIPAFDAFCLAMSTVSTGGFMPREGTIELYGSPPAELVLAVFMLASAVSVIWLRAILQKRWTLVRDTREPFWIISAVALVALLLTLILVNRGFDAGWRATAHTFTSSLASAASIISTTGLSISVSAQMVIPYLLLLALAFVGGGRFSTAGGLKMFRAVSMLQQIGRELRLLIYPHGVRATRYGEESTDTGLIHSIWITFAVSMIALGAVAIMLGAAGLALPGALMASAGALSNIGPVYDMARIASFPNAPGYAEMSSFAQLILCLGMIAGRVEILALLTIFNLANWRN